MGDAMTAGVVLKYLQDNGYTNAAQHLEKESQAKGKAVETASSEQYRKSLTEGVHGSTANHILFWSTHKGDPSAYDEAYSELRSWIFASLDMFQHELFMVAFPLFIHCFLELMTQGCNEAAASFLF